MYFLSFETSTKVFSLALNKDEKVLRFRNVKSALILEDAILPTVDKMLDAAGITFDQIDGFAIALGPGSFTSLRVGLATVKAFAMAHMQAHRRHPKHGHHCSWNKNFVISECFCRGSIRPNLRPQ